MNNVLKLELSRKLYSEHVKPYTLEFLIVPDLDRLTVRITHDGFTIQKVIDDFSLIHTISFEYILADMKSQMDFVISKKGELK